MSILQQLLAFALSLTALLTLSRWVNRHVQIVGLIVSGRSDVALMAYWLILFPGIVLHELSHFIVARLLGLKVGRFDLGPKRHEDYIELGSVTIASGGVLLDSLVGLAPFVFGTAVLLMVGFLAFDMRGLGRGWELAGWNGVWRAADGIWLAPDFAVWAYVIFVVSNAMTPSRADRQPWLPAALYLGLALLVTWALGGLPLLANAIREQVIGALQVLTLGFLFTLAVNLIVAAILWIIEMVAAGMRQPLRAGPPAAPAAGLTEKPKRR